LGYVENTNQSQKIKRSWKVYVGAVPIVLALAGLAIAAYGHDKSDSDLIHSYRVKSEKAQEDNADAEAELCLRRLALGSSTDVDKYRLAELESKHNRNERARELLGQIVSPETPGYSPAHFLLAHLIAASGHLTVDQKREVEAHLGFCLKDDGLKYHAHLILGEIHRRAGGLKQAEDHFKIAMVKFPDNAFLLAEIYRAQNLPNLIPPLLHDFLARGEPRLNQEPGQEHLRLLVADAYKELDEFQRAMDVLQSGRRSTSRRIFGVNRSRSWSVGRNSSLTARTTRQPLR